MGTESQDPPSSSPSPRKRPAEGIKQFSDIMELPFLLVASIAIGGGAGYLLDKHFQTSPVLTLILGLLGFAGGMTQLVRRLSKDTKDNG